MAATLLELPDPLVPATRTFYFKDMKWLGGNHDGYHPRPLKHYLAVRKVELCNSNIQKMLVYYQSFFTFGLLESVFEIQVPKEELLSADEYQEGSRVMTDKNIHTLLADWQRRTRQLSESHPDCIQLWEDRVDEDLNLLETLLYKLASLSKSLA